MKQLSFSHFNSKKLFETVTAPKRLILFCLVYRRGSEWGYLDNTKHFIFGLCNMKQLSFSHFNSKKLFETVTAPKRLILFCLVYQRVFDHFTAIPHYFRRFPKALEDCRRFPEQTKRSDHCRRCPKKAQNT